MADPWDLPKGVVDSGSVHTSKWRLSRYSKSLTENMSETGRVSEKVSRTLCHLLIPKHQPGKGSVATNSISSNFTYLQWLLEWSSDCSGKAARLQKLLPQLVPSV